MKDDLLDYTATEVELGKPAAHDLAEGKITFPFLLALEKCDSFQTEVMWEKFMRVADYPDEAGALAIETVIVSILPTAEDIIRERCLLLMDSLKEYRSGEWKDGLRALVQFISERGN